MSDDYTKWDSIRQTQAYLLDEAERIKNIFRKTNNSISKKLIRSTMLVSAENKDMSLVSIANVKRKDFFDLPGEFTTHLHPDIKVYKTYIDEDGSEHDYLLPMGEYLGRRTNDDGMEVEATRGVVVKSVEFIRLGGNPAEVDTNIKFNLKLFAQDITTFFVKNETSPVIPYTPQASEDFIFASGRFEEIYATNRANEQVIIAQVAAASGKTVAEIAAMGETTPSIQLLFDAARQSQQGREARWDREDQAWDRVDKLALSAGDVGPNGERRTAWIDLIKINPGQPLNDGDNDTVLVTSENQVRIKVEIGYATPNTKPINYNKDDWEDWAEVIGNQKEVFYLSLFKHQFDFRGYDGVDLSIDFIASSEAQRLTPKMDLFSNSQVERKLARLRTNLKQKQEEYRLAGEQEGETTEITERCQEGFAASMATIENKIRDINVKNKLRILNQIYLLGATATAISPGDTHYSRVYQRSFGTPNADSRLRGFQRNVSYQLPYELEAGDSSLGVADINFATGDAGAEAETTQRTEDDRNKDYFIFLGDIIDAALETAVPGNEFDFQINRGRTIPIGATDIHSNRQEEVERQFGGLVGGWVTYKSPNDVTKDVSIPIRDIPIAMDIFRSWWLNNYVMSGKKSLPIKDFITQLIKFVENSVFKNIPIERGTNEGAMETPSFIINDYIAKRGFLRGLYARSPGTRDNVDDNRVTTERLANVDITSVEGGEPVLFIEQANNNPIYNDTITLITFGETKKGILKGVTFQREDIPGHAEARLFSDRTSVAGNIALREKYNTKLDLLGTTSLLPGSLFYLDPLPLDLGYSQTEKKSFARQLGLGGMYRVVNLTSQINFDSAGSTWETAVNTKWESFGDGHDGASRVEKEEQELGSCAELEATAAENRAEAIREEMRDNERDVRDAQRLLGQQQNNVPEFT